MLFTANQFILVPNIYSLLFLRMNWNFDIPILFFTHQPTYRFKRYFYLCVKIECKNILKYLLINFVHFYWYLTFEWWVSLLVFNSSSLKMYVQFPNFYEPKYRIGLFQVNKFCLVPVSFSSFFFFFRRAFNSNSSKKRVPVPRQ